MILSVSRRTDIPAFYSEWFMKRLEEGFVYVRNPMNANQISNIPLSPKNVDCIVFWTKDSKNIIQYLNQINEIGYKYYFQFTITPYDKEIENNVRDKREIIETFKELSKKIGKEKVILRYDPIFIQDNGKYSVNFHIEAFEKLIDSVSQFTKRVVISFIDGYRKVATNMKDIKIKEISNNDMRFIARHFSDITKKHNLQFETCAEEIDLKEFDIIHSQCIDGDLIEKIVGYNIFNKDIRDDNRLYCGCMKCVDIGQYDSCIHNCAYCYANINKKKAFENYKKHNQNSPILFGDFNAKMVKERTNGIESFKISQGELKF